MREYLIVVTGASSGIGYSLALELANQGYAVLAIARRQELLTQLTQQNSLITALAADITQETDRAKIIAYIKQQDKPIHLVHNAAVAMPQTLLNLSESEWQQALAINVEAPLWLTQACMPYFSHSRVLHISSGLAHRTVPGTAVYSMTKAAFFMLYQVINAECDPTSVIAGTLRPGVIDTPMQQLLRATTDSALPAKAMFEDFFVQNKLRTPESVAKFITKILLTTTDEEFKAGEWDIDKDDVVS